MGRISSAAIFHWCTPVIQRENHQGDNDTNLSTDSRLCTPQKKCSRTASLGGTLAFHQLWKLLLCYHFCSLHQLIYSRRKLVLWGWLKVILGNRKSLTEVEENKAGWRKAGNPEKVNYNAQSQKIKIKPHQIDDTKQCEIIEGWVFHLKEKKSGAHSGVPSENFRHGCNSTKLCSHPECESMPENGWMPVETWQFFTASMRKQPYSSLSSAWLLGFQQGPFQKNELGECKHGGDGWHFPKLCLAISCGSSASRQNIFFFDDKDILLWSSQISFVQIHAGKTKKESYYLCCTKIVLNIFI